MRILGLHPLARALFVCLLFSPCLWGQQEEVTPEELVNLDLEELMNIEVTSVSKRPERLLEAAASIFVITGEEIRRSGATSLPEALRLAPNLQVAQTSASGYSMSARGFNGSSANKLLVLIDGRSVYTPLFSGVFWDAQAILLEDVERIEVISGPGGTLWGTNAVNGVINVITRSATETTGGFFEGGAGNVEWNAAIRYGAASGARGSYRVYAKHMDREHSETESGIAKDDAWDRSQAGFRTDWGVGRDEFTLHGAAYRGSFGQPLPGTIATGVNFPLGTISISGANLVTGWTRQLSERSNLSLQAYYDRTERTVPPTFAETLDLVDLQFQHSLRMGETHSVAWGAEYRYGKDSLVNSEFFAFLPAKLNQTWLSVFAQDEITLQPGLRLTLGARLERNDYTGNEFLPNARLGWSVAPDHFLWAAVSRTVRAPSRLDRDAFVPGRPPFLLAGGPDFRSEIANVYELGYRGQPSPRVSGSITAFHADYDHLRTQELAPSRTFVFFGNGMEGTTSGIEMWGTYRSSPDWRLSAGFSGLRENLRLKPGSNDAAAVIAQEGADPEHSWRLRSSHDLSDRSELDLTMRGVAELTTPLVPAYVALDVRYGWKLRPDLELSLAGQNLLDDGHSEFTAPQTRTEFGRSVFLEISGRCCNKTSVQRTP